MVDFINEIKIWANSNTGFIALILFIITLLLGWISGIFRSLRRKPKFKLDLTPGPTFACTFETESEFNGHKTHRTALVLYLTVRNAGSAPSSILEPSVGFHTYTFKYSFLWFWLPFTPTLRDFGHTVGEYLRIFPFLLQKSVLLPQENKSYLREGEQSTGVVYFEQPESWGGFRPRVISNKTKIKVRVKDVFNRWHSKKFWIPVVDLDFARKFNPEFGNFLKQLEESSMEDWIA